MPRSVRNFGRASSFAVTFGAQTGIGTLPIVYFGNEETKKKYHRVERGYGSFVRTFALPEDADADRVKAQFKQGILEVHLPKNEKAKPKQIEVNVA